jgi:D-sedoheptulose 7-phosphate isomerase
LSKKEISDSAPDIIGEHANGGARAREDFFRMQADNLRDAGFKAALCLARGGKILICGNGGSAADSQHIAAEFVNRFLIERPALPAIALTTDTSAITAIGNDRSFDEIFSRQVEALGRKGDILLAISTSGNSPNVIRALETSRRNGLFNIGLSGHEGGKMNDLCDILLLAPTAHTPLIQEIHIAAAHLFCRLTDYYLFENVAALSPYLQTETKV